MSKWVRAWWPCLVVWFIVAAIYLIGAVRQRNTLNLSATAGGQYPYLVYGQGMAKEGWWGHFGDRNRMPVYPALLSLVHNENWDDFVARSSYFAIGSSLAALVLIGVGAYAALPKLHATVFTTIVAVAIFSKYASFVQAELLYYALFFISWLLLCRLLKQPDVRTAAMAGAALGVCFLAKASALPLIVAFALVLIVQTTLNAVIAQNRIEREGSRRIASLAIVLLTFFVICSPYLKTNYDRFGKLFYNVNSTFFMWCDSWGEAEAFANKYKIEKRYPEAPIGEIPSAIRYLRAHSGEQIIKRFSYGVETIAKLFWQERSALYLALLGAICVIMCVIHRSKLRDLLAGQWWVIAFTSFVILGYLLLYVWYAQVAYGERFVLSLMLPCQFGAFWILGKTESMLSVRSSHDGKVRIGSILLAIVLALAVVDGVVRASTCPKPEPTFTVFYFNESRARELAGHVREAAKGYAGVLQLDPTFASAHQSLGMIALRAGDVETAVQRLSLSAELLPNSADARNSLGSALLHAGKIQDAIQQFEAAVAIDPKMAVAWYNLGGSYWTIGDADNAQRVLSVLKTLDARFAGQLEELLNRAK